MHSVLLSLTQKFNPYHDEKGRFATHNGASFISASGFERLRKNYVPPSPKDDPFDPQDLMSSGTVYLRHADAHKNVVSENPPPGMSKALQVYSGNDYIDINTSLRGDDTDTLSDKLKNTIELVDAALAQTKAPVDFIAHRGLGAMYASRIKKLHEEGNLVGATLHDKGYTSTSVNRSEAGSFGSGEVMLNIKVRKGQNGAFIRAMSRYPDEEEFLLPRGTSFNVSKVTQAGTGIILDVDILPLERREDRTKKGDFGWAFTPQSH